MTASAPPGADEEYGERHTRRGNPGGYAAVVGMII